jgi:tetraacyldisaccharide 4'-kinase
MSWLHALWYQDNPWYYPLVPFSYLYRAVTHVRRQAYQSSILKKHKVDVPVIVVGNLTTGGSGKTPFVIFLSDYLKQRGLKVGLVSRGYGGKPIEAIQSVTVTCSAREVGDEALVLMKQTGCPMVVGRDRAAAAERCLREYNVDVIISDDGLQHYAMARDIEIVMQDAMRGFGNGHCLPAGPLRERVDRLDSVDLVVRYGEMETSDFYLASDVFVALDDTSDNLSLDSFAGKTVHAVAGIGYPPRFFQHLRALNIDVIEHPFADHHAYCAADFIGMQENPIVMTEKDAVKCRDFGLDNAWVLQARPVASDDLRQGLDAVMEPIFNHTQ